MALLDTKAFRRLPIYWQIWKKIATYSLEEAFLNRWTNALFFLGKAVRFGMLLIFLLLIQKNIQGFAGYTTDQVIVFFLTYQFIDTITQVFYRGVYLFSWQVRTGELDFFLSKPINPLFRILTGKPDITDAIFFIPTTVISIWLISQLHVTITLSSVLVYLFLLINSFLIATSFHIFVICLGVLTTEVDNAVMLYRDITTLSRFPTDIYREPIRTALFLLIPVGLMNTIPAQVLVNLKPTESIALTCIIGVGFFVLSLFTWKISLKKYTSAGG